MGPSELKIKTLLELARGPSEELKEPKGDLWDPVRWLVGPLQVGAVGWCCCAAGEVTHPAALFGGVWGPQLNSQK